MEKQLRLKKIIALVTSILIIVTGLSLIFICVHIYKTEGSTPFSRETVGKHLVFAIPQAVLTIAGIITGIVFEFKYPADEQKKKGAQNEYVTLKRQRALVLKNNPEYLLDELVLSQSHFRISLRILYSIICIILSIVGIIVTANAKRYTLDDINNSVAVMASVALIMFLTCASLGFVCSLSLRDSASRETKRLKNLFLNKEEFIEEKEDKKVVFLSQKYNICKSFFAKHSKIILIVLRGIVAAISIMFIIVGIFNGGMADVLGKAVKICTECIGLG